MKYAIQPVLKEIETWVEYLHLDEGLDDPLQFARKIASMSELGHMQATFLLLKLYYTNKTGETLDVPNVR